MPKGREKSGRFRKVFVRSPGGNVKVHYRERKPKAAHCPVTGQKLKGVPRERPAKMASMPKTHKRPERPYGGVLSSRAMRDVMKQKAQTLMRKLRGEQK